ncbi:tape measure protein [Lysinibacter sp. HNR]|uniref:phage tail protein n=1 Tax=Lysinibacter sp. HNR TaxID=3031408 RepID=UPI002435D43D|nr:tape measure protein [Lysinibacter sp. HNR]WGD36828.1 tape measure protein [Lysinibacter sp. HNR]
MSTKIAAAYIPVVPSMKGVASTVTRELSRINTTAIGRKMGKQLSRGIGQSLKGVGKILSDTGSEVTSKITKPALAAGKAVATIAEGLSLKSLVDIDNAREKLTGLGHDAATVQRIMDNALASVQGTSFGVGEAASAAAGAVAAGITPGQDLARILMLTADAAIIAGTDLASMGLVFNQVAASSALLGNAMSQLQDEGIPVLQFVAKEMGVTAGEARRLASEGAVSFEIFASAMENGLGGAALAAGDTFISAFTSMIAAVDQIGVALLSGVFPQIRDGFTTIASAMEQPEAQAKVWGGSLGETLFTVIGHIQTVISWWKTLFTVIGDIQTVISWWQTLSAGIQDSIGKTTAALGTVAGAIGPVVNETGALTSGLGAASTAFKPGPTTGALSMLLSPIGLAVGAFAGLIALSPELQSSLGVVFGMLGEVFAEIGQYLGPIIADIGSTLMPIINQLGKAVGDLIVAFMPLIVEVFAALGPIIGVIVQVLGELLAALIPVATEIVASVTPIVTQLVGAFLPLIPVIGDLAVQLVGALVPIIQQLAPVIMQVIEAFLPLLGVIMEPLIELVAALIPAIVPLIGVFMELLDPILALLTPLLDLVGPVLGVLAPLITALIGTALGPLQTAFQAIVPIIDAVVNMFGTNLKTAVESITKVLGGIIEFITGVFTGDWARAWGGIVGIVTGLWEGVTGIIKNVINGIIDAVNGMIGGINDMIGGIGDVIGIKVKIGKIPRMAQGGTVLPTPGGTLAVLAEAGRAETVVDTGKMNALMDMVLQRRGDPGEQSVVVNQHITTVQDDPRIQMRMWGREAGRAVRSI